MVVHQKILHLLLYEKSYGNRNLARWELNLIGITYRLRTPKTGLGEGGGNTTSIKISIYTKSI